MASMNSSTALSIALALTACGSSFGSKNSEQSKNVATVSQSADLSELLTTPPNQLASLVSAFGYEPKGAFADYVGFYTGNRYLSGYIQALGNQVYRIEATAGYYAEEAGGISTIPKKLSCPRLKPADSINGSTNGSVIAVTVDNTTSILAKVTTPVAAPRGFSVEWGCFDRITGVFTEHAWEDFE